MTTATAPRANFFLAHAFDGSGGRHAAGIGETPKQALRAAGEAEDLRCVPATDDLAAAFAAWEHRGFDEAEPTWTISEGRASDPAPRGWAYQLEVGFDF